MNSNRSKLKLDWCSYEAAKYAVMKWHYSKAMPAGKLVKIGVWENNKFIGVIIYSYGCSTSAGKRYGLKMTDTGELVRVALGKHENPATKIVAISIKLLKKQSPGLKLLISFADPYEKHLGIIYQAGNWIYVGPQGKDKRVRKYEKCGKIYNWRTVGGHLRKRKDLKNNVEGAKHLGFIPSPWAPKYKYLYPLTKKMRKQIELLKKPYPKSLTAPEA